MSAREAAQAAKAKGNAFLAKNQFQEAVAAYTEAISHDPSDHVFWSNRSAAYLSMSDAEHALEDAVKCVEVNPKWAKGYGRKGAALYALRQFEEAVAAYEAGLAVEPGNQALKEGLEEVENALFRQQRSGGGGMPGNPFGPDMMAKIAANPKWAAYLADPSFVDAMQKLQKNPDALTDILQAALGQMGAAKPGAAPTPAADPRVIEVALKLIGLDSMPDLSGASRPAPDYAAAAEAEARRRAEDERERARKAREAEEAAERKRREAAEREAAMPDEEREKLANKRKAVSVKEEGNKAYKARQFEDALRLYKDAAALDPEDITYRLNIAAVLFEKGDLDACVAECRSAIERGREVQAPYALIAKAFARIGNALMRRGDLKGALAAYDDSLLESHTDEVSDKAKKLRVELKKRAEQEYRNPELAAKAKEEGNEAFKAGDFPKALERYTEAIKRDPENAVYYNNRATARAKLMDFSAALDDCEMALKLDPKYAKAWVRKGGIQFFRKEFHKAMGSYEEALRIEPDNHEAKQGLRDTIAKIQASSSTSAEHDSERAAKAMADPEIQAILRDPMVNAALEDMQRSPDAMRKVLGDPTMAAKIQKLIAAGILKIG